MKTIFRLFLIFVFLIFSSPVFSGSTWTVDAYGNLDSGGDAVIGLKAIGIPINLNLAAPTVGSITIECGNGACSSSNPGFIWMPDDGVGGDYQLAKITTNVSITLTGATWDDTPSGDISDAILKVFLVNAAGNAVWCVGLAPYAHGVIGSSTRDSTTSSDINLPEELLCNASVSADDPIIPVFWFKADFDDTGGASEDLWTVQTGDGDFNVGKADGVWWTFTTNYSGFSSNPTTNYMRVATHGNTACIRMSTGTGTSNDTAFNFTVPFKVTTEVGTGSVMGSPTVTDNSSEQTTPGGFYTATASSVTISITKNSATTSTWTASGTKGALGQFCYEILP